MKIENGFGARNRHSQGVALTVLLAALGTAGACQDDKQGGDIETVTVTVPPGVPAPSVGVATVEGQVRALDGQPVPGAVVTVAETDARAVGDVNGAYRLTVPSDSTVTLVVSAPGFATTFHESVLIAAGAEVKKFDFLVLAPSRVQELNALGGVGMEDTTDGVLAIRLHSMEAACSTVGAELSVWPPRAGTVVYTRRNDGNGLEEPDLTVTAVQEGTDVGAWLVAAVPPGNGLMLRVSQPGCRLMAQSPSLAGLLFPGERHVAAQSLTQAELFLERGTP